MEGVQIYPKSTDLAPECPKFSPIFKGSERQACCAMPNLSLPTGSAQRLQLSQGTLPTGSTIESTVDRWPETTVPPFSVDPSSGVIPAGKTQKLNVKFSPVEVGDFESNLYCL